MKKFVLVFAVKKNINFFTIKHLIFYGAKNVANLFTAKWSLSLTVFEILML
jgi:hypothetical protein